MNAAALAAENQTLRTLVTSLEQSLQSLQQENQLLRQKLELFIKRYFDGNKNEAIDPKQLELLLAGLTPSAQPPSTVPSPDRSSTPRKPSVRQPLPDHLPVERIVLEPEPVKQQPDAFR